MPGIEPGLFRSEAHTLPLSYDHPHSLSINIEHFITDPISNYDKSDEDTLENNIGSGISGALIKLLKLF